MSNDRETKNYAAGCWVREKTFSNGNSILTASGNAVEFCAWLMSIADQDGKFRFGISRRKELIEGKPTHTVWQDTWKPDPSRQQATQPQRERPPSKMPFAEPLPEDRSDTAADSEPLPF